MTSREKVEYMIRHYQENVSEMKRIDLEIESFLPLTHNELIDMLTFPGKRDDRVLVQHGVDTDKVMQVATNYKKLCWQMNNQQRQDWTKEYGRYSRQVDFTAHAIRRLPRKQRDLMQCLVIDGNSWTKTCELLQISGTTISKLRGRALGSMALTLEDYYSAFGFQKEDFGCESWR